MISTINDLKYYLECDRVANGKLGKARLWDLPYYFLVCLRKYEYWFNQKGVVAKLMRILAHIRFKYISEKCGYTIPINKIGPGLSLPHYGSIVISSNVIIGENCKIHVGVNIGETNGRIGAKRIGNNVYIGPGAKIIGEGVIADNVVIGANAVVIGNVDAPGVTVGGIPAKIISVVDSSCHLVKATEVVQSKFK